jgi:hypothetical protein
VFTATEKLNAVQRELNLRRRVYPNRVACHRMSAAFAAEQIAVFEEIAADYGDQLEKEQLFPF